MSASELHEEPANEESGRESAGSAGESAPRRRSGRLVVGRVAQELAVEAARAVVSAWAPEWVWAVSAVAVLAKAAVRLRWGRGRRTRG
ncbi:hypothetical protein [Streptomyces sp. NPDC097981]|uniref:hypothetical protein n=1 Tax=Streptomyces sp. NPDC097981 TaxID=3155428 RepID=UPI0033328A0D